MVAVPGALAVAVTATALGGVAQSATAAAISFADPGTPVAGPVQLHGAVTEGSLTTTVLYAVDVSTSTQHPDGLDCNGDKVFTPGKDNLNHDNTAGDILDCEIGAVMSLNATLAGSSAPSLVSLERFNTGAAAVPIAPGSSSPLLAAPGAVDSSGHNLVEQAVTGLQRATEAGTDFNSAVTTALNTLRGAPAGPKWIVLLSDGQGSVSDTTLATLRSSGVKLRTYSPDAASGCSDSLQQLAAATGQVCVSANPGDLPATLTGAQPDQITAVRVTIGGTTVSAVLDLIGGWRADVLIGAGTYTARAVATLSSGVTVATQRTFTVAPQPSGSTPPPGSPPVPPAGSVVPTTPITKGTLQVRPPRPLLAALPKLVTGRVGALGASGQPVAPSQLDGATVLLQGRGKAGTAWRNVGRALASNGAYTVTWKRTATVKRLRVALLPYRSFTSVTQPVPRAGISSCRKATTRSGWRMTCLTTARNGARAQLRTSAGVVARMRVVHGHVTAVGTGRPARYVLVVNASPTRHFRLRL